MAVQSPSFPLGIVVITPNALDQLAPADVQRGIQRHQAGDRTGRTANLINERKLLVIRPSFCFLENLFVQFAGQLINLQLFESADSFTHISAFRRPSSGFRFQRFRFLAVLLGP
jgi:hypothetical protein